MGDIVTFDGGRGYLATPDVGAGLGLVVIQEWWGLVPHIEDVCDRFAAEGFTAFAPDMYDGASVGNKEPDEAGKLMMALNIDAAASKLSASVDFLLTNDRVRGDTVGVVGFCMGGGLALVLATRRPDAVGACVPFYGLIPWPDAEPDWSKLAAPVLGHYAELDEFFGPEQVERLRATLDSLGKDAELHVYEGAHHAFFNDTRPEVHDEQASSLAWTRTLEFLRAKLG